MPSEVAPPTKVDTEPQQASTQPGDGSEVHSEGKVPWKDQVLGYAKKTRGTVLGKSATKEHGEKILQGEASPTTPLASTLD
ncbi:hypothetical protein JAAARDRAFT_54523 [Jaapia argillacea MUCL 33604]|uniref:Uncharacterized protein n=1 Tax=Jaapia argillacea MUCL 33604 TaxID=933084 RepID=A0A067Q6C1_9AGAM|nr:hypothetical protein JAAARDRAFT_54523 [Jaapia argillacea MUCL 33604]